MKKFEELSNELLVALGGLENISFVTHCATRLRLNYIKKSLVDEELLKNLPKTAAGFVNKQGQVQVIIGPEVNDAYNTFIEISGWLDTGKKIGYEEEEPENKNFFYFMNKAGNFMAPVFMPIIPALIVGGLILSIRNLLMNYFGVSVDSGTAQIMLGIFDAGFYFLPIWVGYSLAKQLKIDPILGGMLGGILLSSRINGVEGLDFFGIPVHATDYGSTIFPVFLGVLFMAFIYKYVKRLIPEALKAIFVPLITMIIVAPVTLIILGPIGNMMSGYFTQGLLWLNDTLGFFAIPLIAIIYPYMVMFGLDKAWSPIGIEMLATVGYNPITLVTGFVSNLSIAASAFAVSMVLKEKSEKTLVRGFGVTALCGITEPAFYGSLITRPEALVGTAIGSAIGGLVAGLLSLRTFVHIGCPGLLTLLSFVDEQGRLHYVFIALFVALITIVSSFVATSFIVRRKIKQV